MVAAPGIRTGEGSGINYIQQIQWQAPEVVSKQGTTIEQFLLGIVRRIRMRSGMDKDSAWEIAMTIAQQIGDQFGDPTMDWSEAAGSDWADEEMSYWEESEGGSNK